MLTKNNSKLKADGIHVFSLPAVKTCPMAGICKSFCYARKGFFRMSGPRNSRARNHRATLRSDFVDLMVKEIQADTKISTVRVHDSGDFYSLAYLEKWLDIARANPSVHFYAYSKSVSMIKSVSLPDNFRVIFSFGGLEDSKIMANDFQAKIFDTIDTMPIDYANGSLSDLVAAYGIQNKIGLVLH